MAKRKIPNSYPGLLEDIMSLLTPEEQEIALNCLMMERIR